MEEKSVSSFRILFSLAVVPSVRMLYCVFPLPSSRKLEVQQVLNKLNLGKQVCLLMLLLSRVLVLTLRLLKIAKLYLSLIVVEVCYCAEVQLLGEVENFPLYSTEAQTIL